MKNSFLALAVMLAALAANFVGRPAMATENPLGVTLEVDAAQLAQTAKGKTCKGGWRGFVQLTQNQHADLYADGWRFANAKGINPNIAVKFKGDYLRYDQGDTAESIGRFKGIILQSLSELNEDELMKLEKALALYSTYKYAQEAWAERVRSGLRMGLLIVVKMKHGRFDVWLPLPDGFLMAVVFRNGESEPSYIAFLKECWPDVR